MLGGGWRGLALAKKEARSPKVGVRAVEKEQGKRDNPGEPETRAERRNTNTYTTQELFGPCGFAACSDPLVVPSGPLGTSPDPPAVPSGPRGVSVPPGPFGVPPYSPACPPDIRCPWCLLGPTAAW